MMIEIDTILLYSPPIQSTYMAYILRVIVSSSHLVSHLRESVNNYTTDYVEKDQLNEYKKWEVKKEPLPVHVLSWFRIEVEKVRQSTSQSHSHIHSIEITTEIWIANILSILNSVDILSERYE